VDAWCGIATFGVTVAEYTPRYTRGPRLGEDGTSILEGHGYSAAEISALAQQGAFGPQRD
jgi:hypothetical protein